MDCLKWIFIYILITIFSNAKCSEKKLMFKYLTMENGLQHSKINSITQDFKGFLWFATEDGLHRFDGVSIKVYQYNPSDSNSIASNTVLKVFEDKNRNLFICTVNGLDIFNQKNECFKHIPIIEDDGYFIYKSYKLYVSSLAMDKNGKVYVSIVGKGIYNYDFITQSLIKQVIVNNNRDDNGLGKTSVLFFDSENALWIGTRTNGVYRFFPKKQKVKHFESGVLPAQISSNYIYSIGEDIYGQIFIGTDKGLNIYDRQRGIFYRANDIKEQSLKSNLVQAIDKDRNNNLWFSMNGGGLSKLLNKELLFETYTVDEYSANSLNDRNVRCFFEDRQGNYWIGTQRGGVNYVLNNNNNSVFHSIQKDVFKRNTLSLNAVSAICKDNSGNILIGTDGGGLNVYDPNKNSFIYWNKQHIDKQPGNESVLSIIQDKKKNLWVGGYLMGLYRQSVTGDIKFFESDSTKNGLLSNNDVRYILEDSYHNIWIATNGGGVNKYNEKLGTFSHFTKNNSSNSICSNFTLILYEDRSHYLWVGTYEGVSRINILNGQIKNFGTKDGLNGNWVYSIVQDWKGQIWIGTKYGLNLFNQKTQTFLDETAKANLPNEVVCGLLEDNDKNLWISTFNGLVRYNPQTGKSNNYFKQDGLSGNNFSHGTYYKDEKGILYFGTTSGGLVYFDPSEIKENKIIPPVYITSLYSGIKPNSEIVVPPEGTVRINYKEAAFLTINFVALNFISSIKNQYRVKLEGVDSNWRSVENQRYVNYLNLAPGHYIFSVRASNNDNVWNMKGATLHLFVTPPWWKSIWAKLVYLFTIIGFIVIVLYRNILPIRLKKNIEEEPVTVNKNSEMELEKPDTPVDIEQAINDPPDSIKASIEENIYKPDFNAEQNDNANKNSESNGFLIKLPSVKIGDELKDNSVAEKINLSLPDNFLNSKEKEGSSFQKKLSKILIVEDNIEARELLYALLSNEYNLYTASNGIDGIKLAERYLPSLIITDIMMPKMDGIEFCKKIKQSVYTCHIPVIMLTALGSSENMINGFESGADDYISKPFNSTILEVKVKNVIETRMHMQKRFITNEKKQLSPNEITDPRDVFLAKVVQIIEENIDSDDFNVSKLSECLNVTSITLYRKLKECTGLSISQFIRSIRLNKAAVILESKKYSIQEVAVMVGFNDLKYFRKCFHKQFGQNPSEFSGKQ